MWKWAQGAVASVAGTAEPEYGAEAFMSVDKTVDGRNPYGELLRSDLEWKQPPQSHVETQTFYFNNTATKHFGFVQLIHSNPVNINFTSQFTCLICKEDDPNYKVWSSVNLGNFVINGADCSADGGFSIKLNKEGTEYTFASGTVAPDAIINLTFKVVDRGFKIGADGASRYGTDLAKPWGTMQHFFWPRAEVSGVIKAKDEAIELKDTSAMYVMALQGMKPHHAAARWNFCNFQGPTVSVVVMEFETPQSYGKSRSSIGAVVKDGKLLSTAVNVDTNHLDSAPDDVGWPAPKGIEFGLHGPEITAKDGTPTVKAVIRGKLDTLVDRMDVMAELPAFVKRVASGISGTNPYIYVYNNPLSVTVTIDGKDYTEQGVAYNEATFIS